MRTAILTSLFIISSTATALAATCNPTSQLCWIEAINGQNLPNITKAGAGVYVTELKNLMPNLKYIGIFTKGSKGGNQNYTSNTVLVNLLTSLRAPNNYPNAIISFSPDAVQSAFSEWGCSKGDVACLQKNTIAVMSQINAQAKTNGIKGFDMFTVQQSSKLPLSGPGLSALKKAVTNAGVELGFIGTSGCGAANIYGAKGFNLNMPQFYNISQDFQDSNTTKLNPLTPTLTDGSLIPGKQYEIVDALLPSAKVKPGATVLPAQIQPGKATAETIYQTDPPNGATREDYVSSYLAYLLLNHYATNGKPFPCGPVMNIATIYAGLSGEPEFLGDPYWTVDKLNALYNGVIQKLQAQGVDTSQLHFGIWNYDQILTNNK